MSAFDRHPRRKLYEEMAEVFAKNFGVRRSPQNRMIRFEADREQALRKSFPNNVGRQQLHWRERRGIA